MNRIILKNLIDFYKSFQEENTFIETKNSIIFTNSWHNFTIIKKTEFPLKIIQNSESKNYIIPQKIVLKQTKIIKEQKLFPVNKWVNMFLEKKDVFPLKEIPDFKVEHLQEEDLNKFLNILNTTAFKKETILKKHFKTKFDNPDFKIYVGKYKTKMVSTCVIYNNATTNGLYFIATKKEYQNKGFGSKTIKYALNRQIKNNQTKFVLHATNMATKIYEKMGFISFDKLHIFVKI